ncbi:MAG: outer membrane protein assembly factor BamD [Acidobacteria bacterium]|nr:outer membrane protein assembly factor BamD [Acidobacteriota bacterium]MBU1337493.1 outer membrane protein assembly factor BamD [Acidobacteriota bacterium]MBU1474797.1 outer membrane protein assembly factor BamD [Acidobacteriota bacterium]MBU2439192.1 outer membrane protein assembly factor BamD [Acidobacteriota bacterium]MBU4203812.1 outer membrane protein assembly factor BamD [Acidobacteriota bacterium]
MKRNDQMKRTLTLLTVCLLLAAGAACRKDKLEISPEIASSDEQMYNLGDRYIKKDPEKARLYFRQIIDSFPKSFYAQRAKLAIADSYFRKGDEGNMIIAASEYREFISLYPYSPSASYAQLQIALCSFKKALRPGRDQTKTQQALAEFKKLITNFPLSEEAKTGRENIKQCEERLAQHILGIAKHYYRVKAYKASIDRFNEILSNYVEFSMMDQVYFYIGTCNFISELYKEAQPYFTKLVTDYPESKWAEKAQKMIEVIRVELENKQP